MRLLAVLIITALVLAGCAEPAPATEPAGESQPVHSDPATPPKAANVTTAPASLRDHLLTITPEAPVAGFVIDVPKGSAYALFSGSSYTYIHLVFAPLFDAAPEGMTVLLFDMRDGQLISGRVMVPLTGTTYLTAALPSDAQTAADLGSWDTRIDGAYDGRQIGVVVAGIGVAAPVSLAMHVADRQIDVPADGLDILAGTPDSPAPHGTGRGVDVELYIEVYGGLFGTPGLLGLNVAAGDPTVEDRLQTWVPPHGGVRDVLQVSDSEVSTGWSYALTGYLAGEGVTEWHHAVSASGTSASDDGYMVWGNGYGLGGSALVFGLPIGVAAGDGEGAPSATLDLQAAVDNDLFLLVTEVIALDQPISTLLGVAAPGQAALFDGLLRIDEARGDVTIGAGSPVTTVGAWPADPSA